MNLPSKGSVVYVEGYGGAIFAGARCPEDDESVVLLKFEGTWGGYALDELGYGAGIITVPLDEFQENRAYPEQVSDGEPLVESTEKRNQAFKERFEAQELSE